MKIKPAPAGRVAPRLVAHGRHPALVALLAAATLLVLAGAAPLLPAQPRRTEALTPGAPGAARVLPPREAFRKAEGARQWAFPRDHGQHPAYLLEWWYYTGVVRTPKGRAFGYQVTFFRKGLRRPAPRTSAWAAPSLFMAHAAVSDVAGGAYHAQGALAREALGLSGAARDRHRVWLGAWRADPLPGGETGVELNLPAGDFSLHLRLHATAPPLLHGDRGLHAKGPAPGQASWYYSIPRMETTGTVTLGGRAFPVSGMTWMDHEFGTNQLAPDQVGWDWFGLRLSDGRDLMIYRVRTPGGGTHPFSGGTLAAPGGRTVPLRVTGAPGGGGALPGASDATMTPTRWWVSPASGARYPLGWEIGLPGEKLRLEVTTPLENQELPAGDGIPFSYWEGMVRVRGTAGDQAVTGSGYMELTGYARVLGSFFR